MLVFLSLVACHMSLFPSPAHAQIQDWVSINSGCVAEGDVATIQGVECLVQNVLAVVVSLIGIAILVMLVVGAFKLMTSGGDPKAVDAGKQTITYAIGGLVIALSAWFIINFVAEFTGAQSIKTFSTQIDGTNSTP